MELDREKLVGLMKSNYLWCLHCERAYHKDKIRTIVEKGSSDYLQMCAYDGCDGDTVLDGWDWSEFQRDHPMYPSIPVEGEYYHLYPDEKGN